MQPVIVFDVNETLLDLDALHPVLDRVFRDPAALRLWFAHLIGAQSAGWQAGLILREGNAPLAPARSRTTSAATSTTSSAS